MSLEAALHAALERSTARWLARDPKDGEDGMLIPGEDGSPYLLRRYLVRLLRQWVPGLFLHKFYRSDADRELHNHPWSWAAAFVLTGGYVEERKDGRNAPVVKRTVRPFTVNVIRRDTFHRVQLLDEERGAYTLFLAGRRQKGGWGFLDTDTLEYEDHHARDVRLGRA